MSQVENLDAECCVRGGWLFLDSKSELGGECYSLYGYSTYQIECQQTDGEADYDRFKPLEIFILENSDNGIEVGAAFTIVAIVFIMMSKREFVVMAT